MATDLPVKDGDGPAANAAAVTTSDTADLTYETRALYVGGAGDLSVQMGSAVLFIGVQAGSVLPIRVSRVNTTGTTATGIVALW